MQTISRTITNLDENTFVDSYINDPSRWSDYIHYIVVSVNTTTKDLCVSFVQHKGHRENCSSDSKFAIATKRIIKCIIETDDVIPFKGLPTKRVTLEVI